MSPLSTDEVQNEITGMHRFGLVFSHATIGIVVTNSQGTIINVNKYVEEQFGYSKEELLGKNVEILVPLGYQSLHVSDPTSFYRHPLSNQEEVGTDLFAVKKDGEQFPIEISLSSYSFDQEAYVIAFIVDITTRKSNEEILLQQNDALEKAKNKAVNLSTQLEQKVNERTRLLQEAVSKLELSRKELNTALENEKHMNRLKSRFVSMASHEFRTPLSTILSSTFLLEKYNDQPEQGQRIRHIERIKNAVHGLKNILDDFLSVGKLEEGKVQSMEREITSPEISNLMDRITEDMEGLLKPGQHVAFECHSFASIKADVEILKNIMINLVSNAIKYSKDGSIINIICADGNKEMSIAVKDEGIGISPEDMNHLTERFFRGGNASHIQGTGLGLHIVKRYLELIHSRIEIRSELNKGSCFTVFLPKL